VIMQREMRRGHGWGGPPLPGRLRFYILSGG
jgi:hypothetical protein